MPLVVKNVSVTYGRTVAVHDVSWTLPRGLPALLGPNGAGKSSLLRTLATLQSPATGHIDLDGVTGRSLRDHLGYCPQEDLGRSRFTVGEHFHYMCWLHRIPGMDAAQEVDHLLDMTRLGNQADQRISRLSGGMRRRVAIGSAMVGHPQLILLDEPSAGLDVAQRESLSRIVKECSDEAVVVLSTHLVEDIVETADTVTVMSEGSFRFVGSFNEFASTRDLTEVRDRYLHMVES